MKLPFCFLCLCGPFTARNARLLVREPTVGIWYVGFHHKIRYLRYSTRR